MYHAGPDMLARDVKEVGASVRVLKTKPRRDVPVGRNCPPENGLQNAPGSAKLQLAKQSHGGRSAVREEQALNNAGSLMRWAVACAALAAAGVSCRKDKDTTQDAAGAPGSVMGRHWVQDERLRGVMAELSRQAARTGRRACPTTPSRPTPTPKPPPPSATPRRWRTVSRAPRARHPRAVADREMTAETRRGFAAEAERLRTQSLALRDAARGRKVERMQRTLDGISSSCISCHSQYRDFTGEMGPPRRRRNELRPRGHPRWASCTLPASRFPWRAPWAWGCRWRSIR